MRARPVVLIADDTLDHLDLYELALADRYTVLRARNGAEALTTAVAEHPDAVVLDVMMPGDDGFAICVKLRALPETTRIPVLLLTASDALDLEARAIAAGAAMLLHKPCGAERLALALGAAIGTRAVGVAADEQTAD
jgi:CheY-like chemotaxis protein